MAAVLEGLTTLKQDIQIAAACVREIAGAAVGNRPLHTAVILGSGLGAVGRTAVAEGGIAVDYDKIPGMPVPAVAGHDGRLIIGAGRLAGTLLLQGRIHYYEGHSLDKITFATRLLHSLDIGQLVVTNAAGGIGANFCPGDLMLLDGHWTFLAVAEASTEAGRTAASTNLWSERLRRQAAAVSTPLTLHQGVYAMMSGPNYETPAEVRMLQSMNVDAVGMSTVPEALAAARRGMEVLGVSCITNVASGLSDQPLDHAEVNLIASSIEAEFSEWMIKLLQRLR